MHVKIIVKLQDPRFLIVELDGEIWREVDRSTFRKHLKALYKCSSKEEAERFWPNIEAKAAEGVVLRLLSRKGYFSKELTRHLQKKNISSSCIEQVIHRYRELGYIDDEREISQCIRREQAKGRGPQFIAQKLKMSGVEAVVKMDQTAMIQRLLETRFSKYNLKNYKEKQKVAVALQRRGFDFELISALLYK
jgi:regulatory protein